MPYVALKIPRISALGETFIEVTVARVSADEYAAILAADALSLPKVEAPRFGHELGLLDPDWDAIPF